MNLLYSIVVILISVAYALASGVYKVVNVNTYLNIREGGSTSSAVIGSLKNGQYIYATSVSNGWAKFYKGYVSTTYLAKVTAKANYATNVYLNFRTGPSTDYSIITTLKKGTSVTLYAKDPFNSDWAVTSRGYAFAQYLTKKKATSTTKPRPKPNTSTKPKPKPTSSSSSSNNKSVKNLVTSLLVFEEGTGPDGVCGAYIDSLGYPTIGYGQLCEHRVVYNLSEARSACSSYSNGCTAAKAKQWLSNQIDDKTSCINNYTNIKNAYNKASNKRKAIIISMAYQLGCQGLSEFVNTLNLMAQGDWAGASSSMLDSLWARQTPNRAERHSYVIRNNNCGSNFCKDYGW